MDSSLLQSQGGGLADDLSALAWVHEELRKSLDAAHKALRRCLKDVTHGESDLDALDPAILRTARLQIHQGSGALEMAGVTAGAALLRASEAVVQKFVMRPRAITAGAVEDIEQASFALLDYISRKLAGKDIAATELFPQYEKLMARVGQGLPRPTDLWAQDWPTLSLEAPLAAPPQTAPRAPDAATVVDFEAGLLGLLRRQQPQDALDLAALCAGLAAEAEARRATREAATWMLASGFLEGLAGRHVALDVHSKRALSQLLSQLRVLVKGNATPSDRLANELLFFCAQAQAVAAADDSVLARVRRTFGLDRHKAVDLDNSVLGRLDPAWITQAAKRVAAAKDGWSAVAGGELLRMSGLHEQFALVADSLHRLFPQGDVLAHALTDATDATAQSQQVPDPALAMEVATSLLYIEACIDDSEFDHPEQAERLQRLAHRIDEVRQGHAAQPLEAWMEDLYRRVSDRQTIGSVVHELRLSLSDCEKHIDQYFREPVEPGHLAQVPQALKGMRGVLAVLGLDHASHAVVRMGQDIDHLMSPGANLDEAGAQGVFDRIATNLGALGFLIDMVGVQPSLAKSLFAWDADKGVLQVLIGREKKAPQASSDDPVEAVAQHVQAVQREEAHAVAAEVAEVLVRPDVPLSEVSEQLQKLVETPHVADQSELADTVALAQAVLASAEEAQDAQMVEAAREHLSQVVADLAQTIAQEAEPEPEPFPEQAPLVPQPEALPVAATGLEEDDEMRQIFLEEAAEVIDDARSALARLQARPDDIAEQTAVRRAFHTLKGSSRMVGLKTFGDAAWACEQLYNAQLAAQQAAPAELLDLTDELLTHFAAWRDAIALRADAGWQAEPVVRVADAWRLAGERLPMDGGGSDADVSANTNVALPIPDELPTLSLDDVPELHEVPQDVPMLVDVPQVLTLPEVDEIEPLPLSADLATRGVDLSLEGGTQLGAEVAQPALPPEGPWERTNRLDHLPDDEPETQPQALMIEGLSDHELIVLDLDTPKAADTPTQDSAWGELPPDLDLPATEPLKVSFREPAEFLQLSDEDVTQAGSLDVDLPLAEVQPEPQPDSQPDPQASEEQVKVIGDLRISIPLFNIYLNEADEQSRRLSQVVGEWVLSPQSPTPEAATALAHSLAGNSATVGYQGLSRLARSLEHALERSATYPEVPGEAIVMFHDASEEIRRLLHQFAAGFLKPAHEPLLAQLDAFEPHAVTVLSGDWDAAPALEVQGEAEDVALPVPEAADLDAPLSLDLTADEPTEIRTVAMPALDLPLVDDALPDEAQPQPAPQPEWPALTEVVPEPEPEPEQAQPWTHEWDAEIDAVDQVDADLFPIFEEEGQELLPLLATQMRQWVAAPQAQTHAEGCLRTLHTFKGGARLAGAMRLGEMAHQLESTIERVLTDGVHTADQLLPLEAKVDHLMEVFDRLRHQDASHYADQSAQVVASAHQQAQGDTEQAALSTLSLPLDEPTLIQPRSPLPEPAAQPLVLPDDDVTVALVRPDAEAHADTALDVAAGAAEVPAAEPEAPAEPLATRAERLSALAAPAEVVLSPIDWTQLTRPARTEAVEPPKDNGPSVSQAPVRVRPQLLDQLVNHAGEVSITRTRLHAQVGNIRGSLHDLTDNLERLRQHLRDIELQAETQLSTRMEAARAASQDFDPLEFDRYTRFQELTRMMAESVNDVATVQRTLQRSLETAEDQLAAQARLTRDLQDDLLRTRMVEFDSMSDRLYRVVRQAAKETGKQVRLDIVGGATEIDRGVLDRMTGSFEHMLRNCVSHGIESHEQRQAAGKDAVGQITVLLRQEGNEVSIEVRDDGAGLDLARIRARAADMGLLAQGAQPADSELAQFIFTSGFSTAETVTELAGRGIGMDVVRADVNAMGGRIETATQSGQGTSFTLILPLTTAVTKVVMLRCGALTVAVPTHLIEMVRRAKPQEVETAYRQGHYGFADLQLPFYWLGALLQHSPRGLEGQRSIPVVIVRSAQQRVALHVDEVLGNQEVVVKNLGPQLARMPGLAGMTLLASGAVSLIYNPVALATVYGDRAAHAMRDSLATVAADASWLTHDAGAKPGVVVDPEEQARPLVLVVDDSLTVRRVTQRLLTREGYRVKLAKDGMEALEALAQERPVVVLSDIEMPRMDGFDLVRNMRADEKLAGLPVIMITSRIAQKHRDYAQELGVDHYLGKPYGEEELLSLVARYAAEILESA